MTNKLLEQYIKINISQHNKIKNLFETSLRKFKRVYLTEISEKTITRDFQSAKEFIDKFIITEKSAIYCLDYLMNNLKLYAKYLKIPSDMPNSDMGYRLKNSFLYKNEKELKDENVKTIVSYTLRCVEILLKKMENLSSHYAKKEKELIQAVKNSQEKQ